MQSATNERTIKRLKWAIWAYFFLLIFEGVFRKWLLPQYSDVLLVVRDPVVLVIYMLAIKAKLFPRTNWILSLGIIGVLSWLVAVGVGGAPFLLLPLVLLARFGVFFNLPPLPPLF